MIHDPDGQVDWKDTQALLSSGYRAVTFSMYLAIAFQERDIPSKQMHRRQWLRQAIKRVSFGRAVQGTPAPDQILNIAITASGLRALGVPVADLDRMPDAFRQGMSHPRATRALHDVADNAPENWQWGNALRPEDPGVDMLLIVYALSPNALDHRCRELLAGLGPDARTVAKKPAAALPTGGFNFSDGISQPYFDPAQASRSPDDLLKPGELILGYRNELGQVTDTYGVTLGAESFPDFGLNGAFLVCRQFRQNIDAFRDVGAGLSGPDRNRAQAALVGRWPSGAPLTLHPSADPGASGVTNRFGYATEDPLGYRCPLGAHIRRANLRDTLTDNNSRASKEMRQHRMLRRGRPLVADIRESTPSASGLMFVALMGNIRRQFEFVQEIWIMNPAFRSLGGERDPILSPEPGHFTMQRPVGRRRIDIPKPLTSLEGGGYFLLPGRRDLQRLAGF